MTLRAKLVAALGAMLAIGLLAFGLAVYSRYSAAEYRRLDDRLRESLPSAERELHNAAGLDPGEDSGAPDGPRGGRALGIGSYAELRDGTGTVLAHLPNDTTTASPSIPDVIASLDKVFTTRSFTGTGDWRALARADSRFPNLTVTVATPLGDVAESLRGLILIEAIAAIILLALLTVGAWLILRQGLKPVETMAAAGSISDGDMSRRVTTADGTEKVGQLGNALMPLTRLDERRQTDPIDVDLAVLAAESCRDAMASHPDRQITLDAPRPARVAGVPDELRQAIAILVSNALTHTPAGTPLEVSTFAIAHRGLVIVRDHGAGLGDEALDHAFDRSWQADPSRVGPKSGLGLSIVQAIAASHSGTASVRNHPDGGAEFTIDLPLTPNLPPPLAGPPKA